MTEATRNALLRRVDWRFLLPWPEPQKTVCFAKGTIAEALNLVSGDMLAPDSHRAYGCDLAVAINPSAQCMREAWTRLRPGGVLYAELPPAPITGAPMRSLGRAGFDHISIYRPWPAPDAAFCWAPTNSVAARGYLFGPPRIQQNRHRQYRDAVRGCLKLARFRFSRELPVCVIARKPPVCAGGGLDEIVRESWSQWNNRPAPRMLSQLLLTPGARSFNKVVNLFFEEPASVPTLAVKLARVRDSESALAREARTLDLVHSALPNPLEGVPRVLFRTARYGSDTFGETGFAGVPIFTQVNRRSYRDLALKATQWLLALPGVAPHGSREEWRRRIIEPVLGDFEQCYGAVAGSGPLAKARDMISHLPNLPLTFEQRDFSPWNILISSEGKLSVLDWESAQLEGLPMLDLVYFLAYLAFFLDRADNNDDRLRSYRAAFEREGFTGAIHAECFSRYAQALKLSPADLRPLSLFTWMVHARSEYRDLAADRVPSDCSLRNSLFFNLWRLELERPMPRVE